MRLVPSVVAPASFGTPASIVREAIVEERVRLKLLLDHLQPISSKKGGLQMDIATAAAPEECPLDKVACPTLVVSAEDDLFGTAERGRAIAAPVANGRTVIYPSGGHALVGRQSEVLYEVTLFFRLAISAGVVSQ